MRLPAIERREWLRRVAWLGAGALGAAALGGCVVAPLPGYGAYEAVDGPYANATPPMPPGEVIPAAPGVGYVWIGGYWAWQLGRYTWIGGRWAMPPRGHAWVPGYWRREGPGWRWRGGYWQRR
ncbi:MAG: YXWGXW repeat-containing protein [Proteobacteria bacterium]|nr:YXWGXW repeat-containing protein [Pseudomonadota bacterium]